MKLVAIVGTNAKNPVANLFAIYEKSILLRKADFRIT